MAALCQERRRRHQYRKSRQRQSAFGQQDVEENDQQTIPLDVGSDLLHGVLSLKCVWSTT
jgi:hypothetical protein